MREDLAGDRDRDPSRARVDQLAGRRARHDALFGAHACAWNAAATLIRQRAVPDAILGRVTGVYMVGVFGGMVLGTPIGGLPARELGITASVWFGVIGSALLVTILWRQFDHMTHSGDVARAS